ncbi:MAG: heme ABC exporter ATP-binding protein CcmA [Hyphomicrobium sp.]
MQLIAENLDVERGGRVVLSGVSLTVASGEAVILTGVNGAGKTTLLRTLAGYLKPVAGVIRLDGGDGEKTVGEHCHVVGHANAIKPSLTVAENVAFWADFLSESQSQSGARCAHALSHFGLTDLADFPAQYLSAGQKRRLGLARLLAAERPIWLLDEPTVSLDTASVELLAAALNAHTASGGLVIAATHLPLGIARARDLRLTRGAPPA